MSVDIVQTSRERALNAIQHHTAVIVHFPRRDPVSVRDTIAPAIQEGSVPSRGTSSAPDRADRV